MIFDSINFHHSLTATPADIITRNILVALMQTDYDDFGQAVRPHYADGTPAHTRYLSQFFEIYHLDLGHFPITNMRYIAWKSAIKEMLWMFVDQSNNLDLLSEKYGITWWDSWDIGDRTIGQRYGATVSRYDLFNKLINGIKEDPMSRRHILSLWQYADFNEKGGLHPCAYETLWTVRGEYLDCTLTIRSNDFIVAGHIDRIQYTAMQMVVAHYTGYKIGHFAVMTQNMHMYDRHTDQCKEMLAKKHSPVRPTLKFEPKTDDYRDITIDDFTLVNYSPTKYKEKLTFELAI